MKAIDERAKRGLKQFPGNERNLVMGEGKD
jgi:hypothetical protein